MTRRHILWLWFFLILITACSPLSTQTVVATPTVKPLIPWIEEEVVFKSGLDELHGILTFPANGTAPFPSIIIISGSIDPLTGKRPGIYEQLHIEHARRFAQNGYAALRYDPPGVGKSTDTQGFENLESRTREAYSAINFLQSRSEFNPKQIGLWGASQGVWVITMAAAEYPGEVAFLIGLSGSGVSVAEQQIYSVETQSKAANFSPQDTQKAVLFFRVLLDWEISQPIYKTINETDAKELGEGIWNDFMRIVYYSPSMSLEEQFNQGIAILENAKIENWAKYLYLDLTINALKQLPVENIPSMRIMMEETLLIDPQEYVTRVICPIIAFFGERDELQPTQKSVAAFQKSFALAGNKDYTIITFPDAGHSIEGNWEAYWSKLELWLEQMRKNH